ncbi:hypothetical protein ATCC90586_010850 [Pythium insidiosum]|nr:hypothetical protein ATCC90586_010850 [Pythium insidiosum]
MGVSSEEFRIAKLQGQDDFEDWQREIFTFFRLMRFDTIVTGDERIEDCENRGQRHCFTERLKKAMAKIVFTMSYDKGKDNVTTVEVHLRYSTMAMSERKDTHANATTIVTYDATVETKTTEQGPMIKEKDDKVITWYLDSGSEVNVCNDLSAFEWIEDITPYTLNMMSGAEDVVTKKGSVVMYLMNEQTGKKEERVLHDVYYDTSAIVNLISMDYLQVGGFFMSYSRDQQVCFATSKKIKLRFDKVHKLYCIRGEKKTNKQYTMAVRGSSTLSKDDEANLWHQRFAHVSTKTSVQMQKQGVVEGLNVNKDMSDYDCVTCTMSKAKRMTYAANPKRAIVPLHKLSVDLAQMDEPAMCGSKHVMLVGCEATRFKWCFLLKKKSEATELLIDLIKELNHQFKKNSVKILHADGGGEFQDQALAGFCKDIGVVQQFTNPFSPEENSVIERANGTLATRARSLLVMTGLPEMLWGMAFIYAVDTFNVTGTSALNGRTPHELLFGKVPDDKLKPRAVPALFVGYSKNTKGYVLLQIPTCKVLRHRDGNIKWYEKHTITHHEQIGE